MTIVVSGTGLILIPRFSALARRLNSPSFENELFRGVVDAGRRVKTGVQKATHKQMAMKSYSFVVQNTRGFPRRGELAFDIFGVKGGQRVEQYKNLRVVKSTTKASILGNLGRGPSDAGQVKSGVWNAPRIFKRSFATETGFFAVLPGGGSGKAPKALWTFGLKANQPRDAQGRFGSTGKKYGKIRRLYGGSLMKEIGKDASAAFFVANAAPRLLVETERRVAKFLRF